MNTKRISFWLLIAILLLASCEQKRYVVTEISGTIVEMDESYDYNPNKELEELVLSYKTVLDKKMNQVIGTSAHLMDYGKPESLLTNFTSDVMKQHGDKQLLDGADIGVMNVNGHRATMPKGEVTLGNLYEIYSFDNTITFLQLKGSDVQKMFDSYARMNGAGISSNVRLNIKDRKVERVTIDGQPVDKDKIYNIVTLDYLADGNNGMEAFLDAVEVNNTGVTLRDMMIEYVKEETAKGNPITSKLDGRITVIE